MAYEISLDKADIERFWDSVDRSPGQGPSGRCWGWTKAVDRNGYGHFKAHGKMLRAHRVSWTLAFGSIPEGVLVCHSCDWPGCCNWECLFLGDNRDNMRDKAAKGRCNAPGGSLHYRYRFSEAERAQIVAAYLAGGVTQRQIAAQYEISQSLVSAMVMRSR